MAKGKAKTLKPKMVYRYKKGNESISIPISQSSVKWYSSKKYIATVNSRGKVTAKKIGTTVIKAKIKSKSTSCKILVKK